MTHDGFDADDHDATRETVGAYVLGVLDAADGTAFEEHLVGCEECAERVRELAGMESVLAMLADGPGRFGDPPTGPPAGPRDPRGGGSVGPPTRFVVLPGGRGTAPGAGEPSGTVGPGPRLLDRILDEVAVTRVRRRRRSVALIAAAAVLLAGGTGVAVAALSEPGGRAAPVAAGDVGAAYFKDHGTRYSATDPATKVSATVGVEGTPWGTSTVLELRNVKGPLKCRLVAVSGSGDREVVTSWSVPAWGYGIPGSPNAFARRPLYVRGGAAVPPEDIDHFEVTTFDGMRLVRVPA